MMVPSFATLADSTLQKFNSGMKGNLAKESTMIESEYGVFEKNKAKIAIEHRKKLYNHEKNLLKHQTKLYQHDKQLRDQKSMIGEIKVEQKTNINSLNKKNAETAGNIANNSKSIANNSSHLSLLSTKLDNQTSVAQGLQNQFNDFKADYENYKTRTNSAIAGVTALSMLPQPTEVGKGNFAIGVGHYYGETATAIGFGYSVNETVTLRTGASYSKEMKRPAIGAAVAWNF